MRQFDVCRLRDGRDGLVVVLQNDIADMLDTRIVAPLSDRPYKRLIADVRLTVEFGHGPCVLQLDRMAAIDKRAIGGAIGNIAAERDRIVRAVDLLFTGV